MIVGLSVAFATLFADRVRGQDICDHSLRVLIEAREFGAAYVCGLQALENGDKSVDVLLVVARAAQETGRPEVAAEYVRRARTLPMNRSQKFAARLIGGMAEAALGNTLAAKLQLRRASDFAGNPVEKEVVARALAGVAAGSPWRGTVRFGITPSDNINGGSLHDTITWLGLEFPLDADARAQAGTGYSLGGDVSYTRLLGDRVQWENTLSFDGVVYDGRGRNDLKAGFVSALSYAAGGEVPGIWKGSLSLERRAIAVGLGEPAFGDYMPYTTTATAGLERFWQPEAGGVVSLYGTYSYRRSDSGGADARIAKLGGFYRFDWGGGQVQFGGYLEDVDTTDANEAARAARVSLGYARGFDGFDVSVRAQVAHTEYRERLFGYPAARVDDTGLLELSVTPTGWQFYGFRPRFGVVLERQVSNLDRYDTQTLRFFTGLDSAF